MNKHFQDQIDAEAQEQELMLSQLSEHLQTLAPAPMSLDKLEQRLSNRIQISIAKHSRLHTVRSKEGAWQDLIAGIRYKPLWESPQGNSVLVEFAPDSALPLHRHNYLEEGIVLSGSLQLDDLELTQFDYHVSPAGSRHGRIHSKHGGMAYLRGTSLGQPLSMIKEVLGGLLPKNHKDSESIFSNDDGWIEIQNGLYQKVLWTDGTQVEGHSHPLDEECIMLSGEIFLGDILLQAGDHHLAPAGTEHLGLFSDTGALLYVRGAA
jgi:quercetin dioxygenase-like cupin family protein